MLVNLVMVLMRFLPWIYCALSTCNSSLGLKGRIDDLRCAKMMQLVEKMRVMEGKTKVHWEAEYNAEVMKGSQADVLLLLYRLVG